MEDLDDNLKGRLDSGNNCEKTSNLNQLFPGNYLLKFLLLNVHLFIEISDHGVRNNLSFCYNNIFDFGENFSKLIATQIKILGITLG